MNKCYKCGETNHLLKQSPTLHVCRPCNTKRARAYRATKAGREKIYKAVYASIAKLKYKQDARYKLNNAIKSGAVIRPKKCSKCLKRCKPHGHHEDYTKPLKVLWLCRACHADIHRFSK